MPSKLGTSERIHIFWDERVLQHDTGLALHETVPPSWFDPRQAHTEGPERVATMVQLLGSGPLAKDLVWREGRLAGVDELTRVHDVDYVDDVARRCREGGGWVTGTTRLATGSWEPLLAAAGTALAAAESVLNGDTLRAYALVRPPGHHAQPAQADGYCFFNHAALVADLARRCGAERVAVVDWDVHHGNGTQDVFYDRDDVLTISLHMNHGAWGPSHPQTGQPDEHGVGKGVGHNVNVALPLGAGDTAYLRALDEVVAPLVDAYAPDLLVCASGQDAGAFDPNGRHNVTMKGFRGVGARMRHLADRLTGGRLVAVQEGGYNPAYAAMCLLATLEGLESVPAENTTADPLAYVPDQLLGVDDAINDVRSALRSHWPTLG